MANLRSAMDAAFWDLNVASPQTFQGSAKHIPGDPAPMDGARASRVLRIQQISLLRNGFPLGIIPSISPNPNTELGSFSLQSLLLRPATNNWWLGLVGQLRPKKLISAIKSEISSMEEFELPVLKDAAKHFLDKSLYSVGLFTQLALSASSSLLLSREQHGEREGKRNKLMLFHKLPDHDVTLEAAWPDLFIDHKGRYWEVPESVSLDMSSLVSESGLRYRFNVHNNRGQPQAVGATDEEAPSALMPGLCVKAGFSYVKSRDIWRVKETEEDYMIKTDKGVFFRPAYDERLKEPHAKISGIIGGTCEAWLGTRGNNATSINTRSPFNVDLFGSFCYTFQHGKFRELFGDLTRFDARLDISSVSAIAKRVFKNKSSSVNCADSRSSPSLNLIFQQQVAGPIVFRVDSRVMLGSSTETRGPHIEDTIYSLNYSLRLLKSGKVVAWYSPKRKEGMIELRLFEF